MNSYGFLQHCTGEAIAFGAKLQLFVSPAALEDFAVRPVFTATTLAFLVHVVTARATVKQARSRQMVNTHEFTPSSVFWIE